ncbi:unnamed protein product [Caenorhabditis brenneri]
MAEPNQNVPGAPVEAPRTLSAPKAAFNRTQQYISEFVQKLEAELDYAQEHINDLKQQLFEQSKPESMTLEEFTEKFQSHLTEKNNKIAELQALIRGLRMELEQKKDDEVRMLYIKEKLKQEKEALQKIVEAQKKELKQMLRNKDQPSAISEVVKRSFSPSGEVRRQMYKQTKNKGKIVDNEPSTAPAVKLNEHALKSLAIQESNNNSGNKSPVNHLNQVAGPSVQNKKEMFDEEEVSYEMERLKFNVCKKK